MKCIKNNDKYMKVPEHIAESKIKSGWQYCPKTEFKKAENKEIISKPQAVASNKPKKARRKRPEAGSDDSIDKMIKKKD